MAAFGICRFRIRNKETTLEDSEQTFGLVVISAMYTRRADLVAESDNAATSYITLLRNLVIY